MADRRSEAIRRRLVRWAMTAAYRLMRIRWFLTRPRTYGVRAIVVTRSGDVVLLRHSYVRGWHLPGGGRKTGEVPEAAVLRELREEIGLEGFDSLRHLGAYEHRPDFKRDRVDLFLIEGADYRWRRSAEIEEVRDFDPRRLPLDISRRSQGAIVEWLETILGDSAAGG